MRYALLVLLVGCERAEPTPASPTVIAPEAPPLETIRTTTAVSDAPPPRAAPIAPDLVGLPRAEQRWFLSLTPEARHAVRQQCRAQRNDPCAGLLRRAGANDAHAELLAALAHDIHSFCTASNGGGGRCNTPLVLAFDAQPVVFERAPGSFAFEPGQPVASDWPTAATPWLALDRDGDGAITSGAELFGDATARDGFEALAALDANHDGVIDRHDPAFASLLVWADADRDRQSASAELTPLADLVTAIPLAHHIVGRCVRGNCEGERGTFTWGDGRTGAVVDVYLKTR